MLIQFGRGFAEGLSVRCLFRPELIVSLAIQNFGQDAVEKRGACDTQSAPDWLVNRKFVRAVNSC